MKQIFLILGLAITLAGCITKKIYCLDIGNTIKMWTVYNPGDSLVMKDQYGNVQVFHITNFENKSPYYSKETRGLVQQNAVCIGSLKMSDPGNFFRIEVESASTDTDKTRNPTTFYMDVTVGDAIAQIKINLQPDGGQFNHTLNQTEASMAYNYFSPGEIFYPQAVVVNNPTTNVWNFVYVQNKGLVEFSTKSPQRNWVLQ